MSAQDDLGIQWINYRYRELNSSSCETPTNVNCIKWVVYYQPQYDNEPDAVMLMLALVLDIIARNAKTVDFRHSMLTFFNPFAVDNTPVCHWKLEHANHITMHVVQRKHFLKNYINSEANYASEFLENLE